MPPLQTAPGGSCSGVVQGGSPSPGSTQKADRHPLWSHPSLHTYSLRCSHPDHILVCVGGITIPTHASQVLPTWLVRGPRSETRKNVLGKESEGGGLWTPRGHPDILRWRTHIAEDEQEVRMTKNRNTRPAVTSLPRQCWDRVGRNKAKPLV